MRILKDIDIIKWNKRLDRSPYHISSCNGHIQSNGLVSQSIGIIQKTNIGISHSTNYTFQQTNDPFIKYDFSFSVSSNRRDDFFKIESILFNNGIHNSYMDTNDKTHKIILTRDIITSKSEIIHNVYDKEYIKYSYHIEGKLTSIVAYITILDDTIEFFQNIWGYNENGQEHCLVKYPIGSIVSTNNDKSKDYMVIEYDYVVDYDKYIINYVISEMENNPKSLVIKYSGTEIQKESNLCYSRNDRINNILN